jgi:hypothetical protein
MKTLIAAAVGESLHAASNSNFLHLAKMAGWHCIFLGSAVPIEKVLEAAHAEKAAIVDVSYRLSPESGERLLAQFVAGATKLYEAGARFVLEATPPVAERAIKLGFFEKIFDGSELPDEILAYLKGQTVHDLTESDYPQLAVNRIAWRAPSPILHLHFGLPTIEATIQGIQKISDARVLDLISLGTDQDAQENFFRPERQAARRKGVGGVPVRTPADFAALYEASRRGNFPMLLAHSGTDDFIRYAEVLIKNLHNAWCVIPLMWFNQLDGRGPWDLEGSIREHQLLMAWSGLRQIPVELHEAHHWGMRDAPDVVYVASAFLAAYNAKKYGVKDYIAQMMFSSPPGTSDAMDLAKMLAILEIIQPLADHRFRIWRQTRLQLLSHPIRPDAAPGQFSASTYLPMALKPHICHIVGPREAHHAAHADNVIAACKIVRQVITSTMNAAVLTADPRIQSRKAELLAEVQVTLEAIRSLAPKKADDPWADAATLTRAVTSGILDAPQFRNNQYAQGVIQTRIMDGVCQAVDDKGRPLTERIRLSRFI